MTQERERDYEELVRKNVEEYGWMVQLVMDDPPFAYTIGLWKKFNHPEIICFGTRRDVAHCILNNIGEMIRDGSVITQHQDYYNVLSGYPVQFRRVDQSHFADYLGWAMWFNDYKPFPALQLFWPDKGGFYPWHIEYATEFVGRQPLLFKTK